VDMQTDGPSFDDSTVARKRARLLEHAVAG
jgi:hypothetical protein